MAVPESTWASWKEALGLDFGTLWDCLKNWIRSLVSLNFKSAEFWWTQVGVATGQVVDRLRTGIEYVGTDVTDWVTIKLAAVDTLLDGLREDLSTTWYKLGHSIYSSWHTAVTWAEAKRDEAVAWINTAFEDTKRWAADSWTWIKNESDVIATWFEEKANGIATWFEEQAAAIGTWFTEKATALNTWIDELFAPITTWWEEKKAWFNQFTTDRMNELVAFWEDPGGYIAGYVMDWYAWIVTEWIHTNL